MKFNKSLIIISLLLIFCISLGAVSAADSADINVNDIDNVAISDSIENEINEVNEGGTSSFADLNETISESSDVDLDCDYKFVEGLDSDFKEGINVTKEDITIDGNGYTIDGSNLARVFNILANNVTLKNINFINCSSEFGSAIYSSEYYFTVINCSFVDCSAFFGGAIYSEGYLTVSNVAFTNCGAIGDGSPRGGSIYSEGSLIVDCCNFTDGSAYYGGAIEAAGPLNVSNCIFTNCYATDASGAIFYNVEEMNDSVMIKNSTFINCGAYRYAGAVSGWGNCSFIDCTFEDCNALNLDPTGLSGAGSICCQQGVININNCSFINSNSTYGGAIYSEYCVINVVDSSFTNCFASEYGGAIYSEDCVINVNSCSFTNCSSNKGGAICLEVDLTEEDIELFEEYFGEFVFDDNSMINCTFTNCISNGDGGAIYSNSSLTVDGCNFVNCYADYGIIYIYNGSVNYNIFDTKNSSDILIIANESDINYNFFAFQNNVTEFPNNLIFRVIDRGWDYPIMESVNLTNWVVLDISSVEGYYFVNFVLNNGSVLNEFMPDYVARLAINGAAKDITIKDNIYKSTVPGTYVVTSVNSGKVLLNKDCRIPTTITPTALSTTYDSGKYFQVKVLDNKKKAVSGLKLTLKVYTGSSYKTVTVTTDKNGIAKYSASKLSIGTHKVIVSLSNANYVASSKTSSIKVSKAPTLVTAKKVTYRKGAKKYFNVYVKVKATKKAIKSLVLKIKVYTGKKYKTYNVKTNSKGLAKLSTRYLKKGTHKVVISTTSKYYTVSKSGKLIIIK